MAEISTRYVRIGTIGTAWGVKGANKITSDTEPPRQIFKYSPWVLDVGSSREETVEFREVRTSGATLAATIADSNTPESAAQLTGRGLFVAREKLANPNDGYYYVDLEGCEVRNLEGVLLGQVARVFNNGANDVLEVRGEQPRLLPFVLDQYVKSVDLAARLIVIDWDADF